MVLFSLIVLTIAPIHSQVNSGVDVLKTQVDQRALKFLKIDQENNSEFLEKCSRPEGAEYTLDESPKTQELWTFIFSKDTLTHIRCTEKKWDVVVKKDFKWGDAVFPADSIIQIDGRKLIVLSSKRTIAVGSETLDAPEALEYSDIQKISTFKDHFASDWAKKYEILETSNLSGITKIRKLSSAGEFCSFPEGSELKFNKNRFLKGVSSAEMTCEGLVFSKGTVLWRPLNTYIVQVGGDTQFGNFMVPKYSYLIHRNGEWSSVLLSKPVSYLGKNLQAGELISTEFINNRNGSKYDVILGISPAGLSEQEQADYDAERAAEFRIYSIGVPGVSIEGNTLEITRNVYNSDIFSSGEVTVLTDKKGVYAFLDEEWTECKTARKSQCLHRAKYIILSSETKFWGVTSQLREPPNITLVEELDFKPKTAKQPTLTGKIKCSPREDEFGEDRHMRWNIDFRKKSVDIAVTCEDAHIKNYSGPFTSVEVSGDLTHLSYPGGDIYFQKDRISERLKSKIYKRIVIDSQYPAYIEDKDDHQYKIIKFSKEYLDEEDAGC